MWGGELGVVNNELRRLRMEEILPGGEGVSAGVGEGGLGVVNGGLKGVGVERIVGGGAVNSAGTR